MVPFERLALEVKAAVARMRASPLAIEGLVLDEPRGDEILVRLVAAGVSSVDLAAIDGLLPMALPFVPGAEAAGLVERVGESVADLASGDAVVVSYASCGRCANCLSGHPRRCTRFDALNLAGRRTDGSAAFANDAAVGGFFFGQSSFATHVLCRASSAAKVSATAPLEVFACLGGDILAAAGAILEGFNVSEGDSLAVAGADAAGLAAIMVAKARGAQSIVVADEDERRRKIATDCGATVAVHTLGALPDAAKGLAGDGVRFAFDAIGTTAAATACRDSVARGGVCALRSAGRIGALGTRDEPRESEPRIISAHGHGSASAVVPMLVDLYENGRLPLDLLINFFAFENVNDALDAYRAGDVVKPVLRFSLGSFGDLDRAKAEGAICPDDVPAADDQESSERAEESAPVTS